MKRSLRKLKTALSEISFSFENKGSLKKTSSSLHTYQVASQAGAYLWFQLYEDTMNVSTPPEWDASPS